MKRILFNLALAVMSTTSLLTSCHAMEAAELQGLTLDQIKAEQQEIAHATPVKSNPGAHQRYGISYTYHIAPTLKLIGKMKSNPHYLPTKEERHNLYICYTVLQKAAANPQATLVIKPGAHAHLKFLEENTNISYDIPTKTLKLNAKAYQGDPDNWVTITYNDVNWAVEHIDELIEKAPPLPQEEPKPAPPMPAPVAKPVVDPSIPTFAEISSERQAIDNATPVKNNPGSNQRYSIGNTYHITPTLKLIQKMRSNQDYMPTKEERTALYICHTVLLNAQAHPQATLVTMPGAHAHLKFLEENTNISYDAPTKTLKLNAKAYQGAPDNWVTITYNDVNWAVEHIDELIEKAHAPTTTHADDNGYALALADWTNWCNDLAQMVNVYFKERYTDQHGYDTKKVINGQQYIVPRPNHALAHGMRTAFIAVDIVEEYGATDPNSFQDQNTRILARLIQKYLQDPNFKKKVAMAAAFQRTGRQSEISGKEGDKEAAMYDSYMEADARIFSEAAKKLMGPGKLFSDLNEVLVYTRAVYNDPKTPVTLTEEQDQLREIVHTLIWVGHLLDLKRLANESPDHPMKKFPPNGIKCSTATHMGFESIVDTQGSSDWKNFRFTNAPEYALEKAFVDKIWNRVERYLEATGDRPESSGAYAKLQDKFYLQAKHPELMVKALMEAKIEMDSSGQ